MKCLLLILLLLIVVVIGSSYDCHENENRRYKPVFPEDVKRTASGHRRIISGNLAKAGQFPWQVSIMYQIPGASSICGGSLIAPRWVLTAGHCADGATHFLVTLGSLKVDKDENGVEIETTKAIVHENYDDETLNNDIALIDLERNVQTNDLIKVIDLPSRGDVVGVGQKVEVSGWGITSDSENSPSTVLNYIQLTSISNAKCSKTYGTEIIISTIVCAVGNKTENICSGDSGGGLVIRKASGDATLVGIVSFVTMTGCAKGYPSGYTRTESYLDWISRHTRINIK